MTSAAIASRIILFLVGWALIAGVLSCRVQNRATEGPGDLQEAKGQTVITRAFWAELEREQGGCYVFANIVMITGKAVEEPFREIPWLENPLRKYGSAQYPYRLVEGRRYIVLMGKPERVGRQLDEQVIRIIDLDETRVDSLLSGREQVSGPASGPPALPAICLGKAKMDEVERWMVSALSQVRRGTVTVEDLVEALGPPDKVEFPRKDGESYVLWYLINPREFSSVSRQQDVRKTILENCVVLRCEVTWPNVREIAKDALYWIEGTGGKATSVHNPGVNE